MDHSEPFTTDDPKPRLIDVRSTERLERRLAGIESSLARLAREVRTGRLVLVDAAGNERLVAQVIGPVAELRLDLPGATYGRRSSVVLFGAQPHGEQGAGVGLQLWTDGNLIGELAAWQQDDGVWRSDLWFDDPGQYSDE